MLNIVPVVLEVLLKFLVDSSQWRIILLLEVTKRDVEDNCQERLIGATVL
jgi:hypothetical protein